MSILKKTININDLNKHHETISKQIDQLQLTVYSTSKMNCIVILQIINIPFSHRFHEQLG